MELMFKFFLSYLIGSISGSILMGKIKGVDIRKMGSGNAGGTNAFRTMGIQFAIVVLFIDVIKGFIAVYYLPSFNFIIPFYESSINVDVLSIICGSGVVLGHVYPLFSNLKGGKGAGTMVGVLMALSPLSLAICFVFWIIILIFTGYVGLSTIIAGIILPISVAFFYGDGIKTAFGFFSIIISLFIIFTHRSNIRRMFSGNENRFEKIMIFKNK